MFKSGDSRAGVICIKLYTESVVDQTNHFDDVFVRENLAYGYDIVTTL